MNPWYPAAMRLAAGRRQQALRRLGLALGVLLLGTVFALLSVLIERHGPERMAYGNMCGAGDGLPCLEPALTGGFPLPYLTDMPGVSVEHVLSFGEDRLDPGALGLDALFYAGAVLGLLQLASRRRIPDAGLPSS